MGWTGTYKEKGESYDDFFNAEYGNESHHVWIGKGFAKNGAYYRAMKNTETGEIFAVIILLQHGSQSDRTNFFYKTMDETEGLTYSGTESDFGMMVEVVNGEQAIYAEDNAYWAIYVNGEYGNYGIDSQPVNDGDVYSLVYEAA